MGDGTGAESDSPRGRADVPDARSERERERERDRELAFQQHLRASEARERRPAGAPERAGEAGGEREERAFQLHRSGARAEQGSNAGLLLVLALVVAAGGGAFFALRGAAGPRQPEAGAGGATPPTAGPAPAPPPAAVTAPPELLEHVALLEREGQLRGALEKAREYHATFPDPQLEATIRRLMLATGDVEGLDTGLILAESRRQMDAGDFEAARTMLDALIAREPRNAEAFLLRGICHGERRRRLEAQSDLATAIELGAPTQQVTPWQQRYR